MRRGLAKKTHIKQIFTNDASIFVKDQNNACINIWQKSFLQNEGNT